MTLDPGPKPAPKKCPACGDTTGYSLDPDGEWDLDGEWWHDRENGIEYADSWRCRKQLSEEAQAKRQSDLAISEAS